MIEKKENKISFNTSLKVKNTKFKIDNINYEKKDNNKMYLLVNGELKNNKNLNINKFTINEEDNKIKIRNLSLNDSNQIIKIDQATLDYLDTENKKNKYNIKNVEGQNYLIDGTSFNANSLISNMLDTDDQKENNFFEKNLNVDLNLDKVYIDKINAVNDLKGTLNINNNKVVDADILAFFKKSQNIKFTIKTNEQGEKITTLFSSNAKPLVDRYKFIKGFKMLKMGIWTFILSKKREFQILSWL